MKSKVTAGLAFCVSVASLVFPAVGFATEYKIELEKTSGTCPPYVFLVVDDMADGTVRYTLNIKKYVTEMHSTPFGPHAARFGGTLADTWKDCESEGKISTDVFEHSVTFTHGGVHYFSVIPMPVEESPQIIRMSTWNNQAIFFTP